MSMARVPVTAFTPWVVGVGAAAAPGWTVLPVVVEFSFVRGGPGDARSAPPKSKKVHCKRPTSPDWVIRRAICCNWWTPVLAASRCIEAERAIRAAALAPVCEKGWCP